MTIKQLIARLNDILLEETSGESTDEIIVAIGEGVFRPITWVGYDNDCFYLDAGGAK